MEKEPGLHQPVSAGVIDRCIHRPQILRRLGNFGDHLSLKCYIAVRVLAANEALKNVQAGYVNQDKPGHPSQLLSLSIIPYSLFKLPPHAYIPNIGVTPSRQEVSTVASGKVLNEKYGSCQ
jgi:hypothetical protein